MAKNVVQFQPGLSLPAFQERFGSEDQCRAALVAMRWPSGFVCPHCGCPRHSTHKTRHLFQCSECRRQTSVTAGTIMQDTKLPLTVWFLAMYQDLPQNFYVALAKALRRHMFWLWASGKAVFGETFGPGVTLRAG